MTIAVGEKLPEGTLKLITADGPADTASADLFSGKKVVLFGLPGAYTGTCSTTHLPGYVNNAEAIKAKGVDTIAVISVNDVFVMGAWAKEQQTGDKVAVLADWDASYVKALGLDIDLSVASLGVRSKRFSMIVDNGVVSALNIEENPGVVEVTGAEKILEALG